MCGLVGFFSFQENILIDRTQLFCMTDVLTHRGPDDSGCVLFRDSRSSFSFFNSITEPVSTAQGSVGLGHRRLSIIDLSQRGRQPMSAANGFVWMVFNGEVYNYIELRKQLEDEGYYFESSTDSEVVLKSYLAWSESCFERFNGMWAIAFYDRRDDKIILSRDRFGKKPLYYYCDDRFLIFASEIKAILKHADVKKEMNLKKVSDYAGRHYRYVDNDNESFFKNIHQVPKSSFMVFDRSRKRCEAKYWHLKNETPLDGSYTENELIDEFRDLLNDAVRVRLRSDVPVGCMLSGGLDSGSITCLAAQQNNNFITFSGVTGAGYYDETEYIKEVVDHTKVTSKFVYPGAVNLFLTLQEMLQYHDEPVCTVTWYSNYLITKEIARYKVPVVLTGHGGDELLAGYWDHYHYNFNDLRLSGKDDAGELSDWLNNHKRPIAEYERERDYLRFLDVDHGVEVRKYSQYISCLSPSVLPLIMEPQLDSPFKGSLSRRLYLELLYETVPPSLRAEDRNMMAFSIENRLPFLDYRLVEFCFRLGNNYKIRNGAGKWILREAMKGVLPDKVRCRMDKTGFNAPADEWFRNQNRKEIEALLEKKSFVNTEIYNHEDLQKRFTEHLQGVNHYMFLWQYINLCLWHDLFFN